VIPRPLAEAIHDRAWLVLFPAAVAVQAWSVRERLLLSQGVIRPAEPFASVQLQPGFSWAVALVYVAVIAWLLAAYLAAAAGAGRIVPGAAAFGGARRTRAALLAAVVSLDYVPLAVWRLLLGTAS
jgi:hypothetical protein